MQQDIQYFQPQVVPLSTFILKLLPYIATAAAAAGHEPCGATSHSITGAQQGTMRLFRRLLTDLMILMWAKMSCHTL